MKSYCLICFLFLALLTGCAASDTLNRPSPDQETVVLVHGLGRSAASMWLLKSRIESAGYDVVALDYPSLGTDPDEVIGTVAGQINSCCREKTKVHFVGYSLGGLLIRQYFAKPENEMVLAKLGHVVMIGTPNAGTAVVDRYRDSWWLPLLGKTTISLGTKEPSLARQLPPPPFAAGIIAGSNGSWFSDALFNEANDGLVSVTSTRLANMADFLEVDVSHSRMRYDREVADQTITFLQTGEFRR